MFCHIMESLLLAEPGNSRPSTITTLSSFPRVSRTIWTAYRLLRLLLRGKVSKKLKENFFKFLIVFLGLVIQSGGLVIFKKDLMGSDVYSVLKTLLISKFSSTFSAYSRNVCKVSLWDLPGSLHTGNIKVEQVLQTWNLRMFLGVLGFLIEEVPEISANLGE